MTANTATTVSIRQAFARALRGLSWTIVAFNFRMIRAFESFIDAGFLNPNILLFSGRERKDLCYSAVNPSKEADRLVVGHEAGPKPFYEAGSCQVEFG